MLPHEREFFVYRISTGYLLFNDLKICQPSIDVLYESQKVYMDAYNEAVERGALDDDAILLQLVQRGLWNAEDDRELEETLPKHIEYFKTQIFKQWQYDAEIPQLKLYLGKAKEGLNDLFKRRHSLDHLTCAGIASFAKWYYIIENSTFRNGKKYNWRKYRVVDVLEFINQNTMTEGQIRDIARSDYWRSIYSSKDKCNGLFSSSAVLLTEDQKRLITWSALYENIREYDDCPIDSIIEDDDALDGWLILKKQEQDKKKGESLYDKELSKYKPNAEVFMVVQPQWTKNMTDEKREATRKEIYGLNNNFNRQVIASRIKTIQEKGEAKDTDFLDVRASRGMAQVNAERAAMKGKNG